MLEVARSDDKDKDLLVIESLRTFSKRQLCGTFVAVVTVVVAMVAANIGSTAFIVNHEPITVGKDQSTGSAPLMTRDGRSLATTGVHNHINLAQPIDSAEMLEHIQSVMLNMPHGMTHMFKVTGFTWYNATDVDLYTDIGQTVHVTDGAVWLAPTTFTSSPVTRSRRLQLCGGVCDAAVGGIIAAGVSHYMGW